LANSIRDCKVDPSSSVKIRRYRSESIRQNPSAICRKDIVLTLKAGLRLRFLRYFSPSARRRLRARAVCDPLRVTDSSSSTARAVHFLRLAQCPQSLCWTLLLEQSTSTTAGSPDTHPKRCCTYHLQNHQRCHEFSCRS
jgi:hypothetical protein